METRADELAIRGLIEEWHRATIAGDVSRILPLMSWDAVFLSAGRPPMRGRDEFAAGFRAATERARIESKAHIEELVVEGNLAYCWSQLTVLMTPLAEGASVRRSGPTLSVFRRQPQGDWVLARDANLLTVEMGADA